jgi:hypothetical protein
VDEWGTLAGEGGENGELALVFCTGGPGVFLGHPCPYPRKTVPGRSGAGNLRARERGSVGFPCSRGHFRLRDFESRSRRVMMKKHNAIIFLILAICNKTKDK